MGRIRRSVTTYRHAPYNLRSRSRVKYDSLSSLLAGDDNPKEYKKRKILPTVKWKLWFVSSMYFIHATALWL